MDLHRSENIESVAAKVRALLAKTTENGCTEDEAIAAALKARELMDKYNLSLTEAQLREEPVVKMTAAQAKAREFKSMARDVLVMAVGRFTETKPWRTHLEYNMTAACFLGIKGDAEFAAWLCEALVDFCVRGADAQKRKLGSHLDKRSFIYGAAKRISERLDELCREKNRTQMSTPGRGLVVATKGSLINAWLAAEGLKFSKYSTRRSNVDGASFGAGRSYGNGASFGRPVNGGSSVLRIGAK